MRGTDRHEVVGGVEEMRFDFGDGLFEREVGAVGGDVGWGGG
jgi:hypothetical protein